jgi:hypothetical protein
LSSVSLWQANLLTVSESNVRTEAPFWFTCDFIAEAEFMGELDFNGDLEANADPGLT